MKGLHFYADKTSNLKNEALKSFVLAVCAAAVAAVGAFAAEPEPVAGVYEGAERFSGDYAIGANARGFRALRLDFHRAPRARIRLYARAYPLFLDIGFGRWLDGLVHVDGEVEPEPGLILGNQPTLASGGVQPDGSLRVCVRLTQTPARLDLVFTGKDGVCAVDGTFTHLTNAWHFTGRRRVPALLDGTPWAARRAAILEAFAAREFGVRPVERPADLAFETLGETPVPQGVRRRVRCSCTGPHGRFSFDFDAFLPKGAKGVSSFVAIGLVYGADQPLAHSLPVDEILARGHALVSFRNWDVAEDDPRTCFTSGVFRAFGPRERGPADWGALSAWAWGASRVMDWIETQGEFDAKRVAVVGHSRCGKTALWAGATDGRFALVCANDSGTGGARLDHVDLPWAESRTAIRASFPHWFCGAYRTYAEDGAMEDLDQHMLLALVAPRRLAVGSASDDFWAGIPGERAASELAAAAWERLGVRGFGENVLYHVRTGVHGLEPEDWRAYMSALEAGRHAVGAPTGPMADYFREARGKYAEADFAAGTNTVIHAYSAEDPFGRDPKLDLPGAAVAAEMPVVYSVPGLRNVRDIGGWTGLRTGRVFRGSELVWLEGCENGVNPETRRMLTEVMKLKSDLDLRGEAKWGIFDYGNRRFVELQAFGIPKLPHGFPSYLGLFSHPETVASALREFAKDENYPIYVHCAGGADRTGSLILLVEALCGVKEGDVDIDYELTSFAVIYGLRHRDEVGRLNWKGFKDELRRRYPADTLNGSVERYVRDLGLTDAEIAAIRFNLTNEKKGEVK